MSNTQVHSDRVVLNAPFALPVGLVTAFGGSSVPTGFLLCDGSAISRTTFANLFSIVGTTFGVGDGSTTFNLPDCRGRAPFGKAASGTFNTLGGTGGAENHTHTLTAHTHTYSTQNHSHTGQHRHSISTAGLHSHNPGAAGGSLRNTNTFFMTSVGDHNHTGFTNGGTFDTVATGTTNAPLDTVSTTTTSVSGVNPFAVVNFIIKT